MLLFSAEGSRACHTLDGILGQAGEGEGEGGEEWEREGNGGGFFVFFDEVTALFHPPLGTIVVEIRLMVLFQAGISRTCHTLDCILGQGRDRVKK